MVDCRDYASTLELPERRITSTAYPDCSNDLAYSRVAPMIENNRGLDYTYTCRRSSSELLSLNYLPAPL
jgi:hypothetical protein